MLDSGEAYNATTKRGWISQTSSTPLSIVGNARDRNMVADQRLDTFIHMQYTGATGGVAQPARWEAAVQNGIYDVTVAVGDVGTVTGSTHRITVESTNLVNNFAAGSANKIATVTARIQVTDGKVTVDAAGGTNTKLDYVDIVPVTERARRRRHAGPHQLRADRRAGAPPLHERHRRRLHGDPRATAGSARPTPPRCRSPATAATATSVPDQRLDTFMHMQFTGTSGGVAHRPAGSTRSRWAPTTSPSRSATRHARPAHSHRITVEGVVAVEQLRPDRQRQVPERDRAGRR